MPEGEEDGRRPDTLRSSSRKWRSGGVAGVAAQSDQDERHRDILQKRLAQTKGGRNVVLSPSECSESEASERGATTATPLGSLALCRDPATRQLAGISHLFRRIP